MKPNKHSSSVHFIKCQACKQWTPVLEYALKPICPVCDTPFDYDTNKLSTSPHDNAPTIPPLIVESRIMIMGGIVWLAAITIIVYFGLRWFWNMLHN